MSVRMFAKMSGFIHVPPVVLTPVMLLPLHVTPGHMPMHGSPLADGPGAGTLLLMVYLVGGQSVWNGEPREDHSRCSTAPLAEYTTDGPLNMQGAFMESGRK